MFRPGVPAPSLADRMGEEVLREQGGVEYRELRSRSLLNRCTSPRMPFEWTVNPYRGCSMGCRYCYAAYTHEFMGIATPEDFHSTVFVKTGMEEETGRGLARVVARGESIALGSATDPYQPGEARSRVTRRFLEQVARHRGVQIGITTKGALVLRDVELLQRIAERSSLSVHVSLNSMDAELLRRTEPWAPPPEVRIEVMRRLVAAGLEVWLAMAPILPILTDAPESLDAVLRAAAGAGVRDYFSQVLFLRSPTREKYLRWLAAEFPRHVAAYEEAYAGGRVYLQGGYPEHVRRTVRRLATAHGFSSDRVEKDERPARPVQLSLL
jgi:DNA repair photolyase